MFLALALDAAHPLIRLLADDEVTIDPTAHTGFDQVAILGVLIGSVLPLLVGLVTRSTTSPRVKSLLLVLLAAVTAVLTEAQTRGEFVWQQALLTFIATFSTAMVAHLGIYRPTGATAAVQSAFTGGPRPPA